jgi:hypothetical protein
VSLVVIDAVVGFGGFLSARDKHRFPKAITDEVGLHGSKTPLAETVLTSPRNWLLFARLESVGFERSGVPIQPGSIRAVGWLTIEPRYECIASLHGVALF